MVVEQKTISVKLINKITFFKICNCSSITITYNSTILIDSDINHNYSSYKGYYHSFDICKQCGNYNIFYFDEYIKQKQHKYYLCL